MDIGLDSRVPRADGCDAFRGGLDVHRAKCRIDSSSLFAWPCDPELMMPKCEI